METPTGDSASSEGLAHLWARSRVLLRSLGPHAADDLIGVLLRHLDVDTAGLSVVRAMLQGQLDHTEATIEMADIEHRGDALRAELVASLAHALVTPIDREDLYRLSRSIDEVVDGLRDLVREWDLFESHDAQALLSVLDAMTQAVSDVRVAIASIVSAPQATSPQVLTAQRSANRIRLVHEDEIAALFAEKLTMRTLRQRELLHRLDTIGLHLVSAVHVLADAFVKRGE
jgi:hypothetical protein